MRAASAEKAFPAVGALGRLSAFMCVVVAVTGAIAELALAWVWLDPGLVEAYVLPRLVLAGAPVALDGTTRLVGFAVSMVPMAILLFTLHQSYELFDAFRLGQVFTAHTPVRLRRIGLAMVVLGVLRPVAAMLLGLALTISNPDGQRILALSISLDDILIAAFGGLVLAIGHVLVEAARLADDNSQIV